MSDYDFILDGMTFSYSSFNTFNNCPHCFKLTYIDVEERAQNAFAEYGSLIHNCLEKYFKFELSMWELPIYYEENFGTFIQSAFPPYSKDMRDTYYADGIEFFNNLDFNIHDYDIISVERNVYHKFKEIDLVIRPDAIIKEKATGKTILLDFKTSKLYNNSGDKQKINGYLKQMYLYVYMLWLSEDIAIDEIWIWFIRNNKIKKFIVNDVDILNILEWIEDTYNQIMNEKKWNANISKQTRYFCDYICSMRNICEMSEQE